MTTPENARNHRTVGRTDLVRTVAERTEQPREIVDAIVRTFLSEAADALARGQRVELRRFGRLDTATRSARHNARNPRTGERVELPVRKVVKFKAGKQLVALVNGNLSVGDDDEKEAA